MLGIDTPIDEAAFFWTAHYDVSIRYVGHAESWDRIDIDGDLPRRDATIRYFKEGKLLAAATLGRDGDALKIAQAMRDENARRTAKAQPPAA
jgi:3-phenylpropionate/trans-cinnamate dioxygenase ferredoxin reductase subunit